ncbi:MAG: phosphatidylinositol dimannoside acyltransferase [Frankiaceae bacterium]|nr:phosphatidylinositol dimannoside acyltransferase [Frankiaceae bacterium]
MTRPSPDRPSPDRRSLGRPNLSQRLVALGYRAGWAALRLLPAGPAAWLFRLGADLAFRRGGKGVDRLRHNLARVLGPDADATRLDEVTRAGLRSYARYWLEVFRLSVIDPAVIVDRMHVDGEHRLGEAMAVGRGMILALAHSGNWDHAGAWLVRKHGIRFTTVAERLEPAEVFDRFVAFRESLGMEVLPLTGGPPPSEVLAQRLRAGGALCLLADRDLSTSGVGVTFFGERATMPAGPAHLALTTGAALLPTVLWFDGDGWAAHVGPPVPHTDVATMTQAMADVFETHIAQHPQDWHMLQRLWSADLEPRRTPDSKAGAG